MIETCDSYAVVPNVTDPANYYGQVRDIRRRAVEAEPNDQAGLDKLISEIRNLRAHLSPDQLKAFDTCYEEAQRKKIGGKSLALRFFLLSKPARRALRLKLIPEEIAFTGFACFQRQSFVFRRYDAFDFAKVWKEGLVLHGLPCRIV